MPWAAASARLGGGLGALGGGLGQLGGGLGQLGGQLGGGNQFGGGQQGASRRSPGQYNSLLQIQQANQLISLIKQVVGNYKDWQKPIDPYDRKTHRPDGRRRSRIP